MKKTLVLVVAFAFALTCLLGFSPAMAREEGAADLAEGQVAEDVQAVNEKAGLETPTMETPDEFIKRFDHVEYVPASDFNLTDEQVAKIQEANLTAGLVLHTSGESYSAALVAGIEKAAEELNVEIIAQTNCNWKAEQQAIDLENVLSMNPDIVIMMQVDVSAMRQQVKDAQANGVQMVFVDNIADGLEQGEYTSLVTSDTYGNGVECGRVMAQELNGEGKVAMFSWSAPNIGNRARSQGFRDYIETNFPDIEIVTEELFNDATECTQLAEAVFAKYPDLDGAFGQWDIPAEGINSAAQSSGIGDDFVIVCVDLGYNVARIMAEGGKVKGIGAQQPYNCGIEQLRVGALGAIGEETPDMILLDSVAVTYENLTDAWPIIYDEPLPDDVAALMG